MTVINISGPQDNPNYNLKPAEQVFVELILQDIGKVKSVNTKTEFILNKAELVRVNATRRLNELHRELIGMRYSGPNVKEVHAEIDKINQILDGLKNVPYAIQRILG